MIVLQQHIRKWRHHDHWVTRRIFRELNRTNRGLVPESSSMMLTAPDDVFENHKIASHASSLSQWELFVEKTVWDETKDFNASQLRKMKNNFRL